MPEETQASPAVDMAMSPEEFAELRAGVAAVGVQDVQLGRVLDLLVLHLGHAHGLDPAAEDAKAKEEADAAAAKAEEDAKAAEQAAAAPVAPAQEGA